MKLFPLPLGGFDSESTTKFQLILETTDGTHCGVIANNQSFCKEYL